MAHRLKVDGITKSVSSGRILFQGLDLNVEAGELVAIIGESGSGKSTLLNIIAGLDHVDSGKLLIDDEVVGEMSDNELTDIRRRKIGFVFQAFDILPYITLTQNVALPLAIGNTPAREITQRALAMLGRVGLES